MKDPAIAGPALAAVTPETRRAALGLAKRGDVYDLGTDLSQDIPQGSVDVFGGFRLTQYRLMRSLADPTFGEHDFNMDLVIGSPHVGSHIDALVHISADGHVFGGSRVAEAFADTGWREHGAETIPPILTRGLLLDVPGALGRDRLDDDHAIDVSDLERALTHAGTEPRPGDAVLVRTGKIADFHGTRRADGRYFDSAPGVTPDAAVWLYEHGMVVLGTDTSATEPVPFRDTVHTTHRAMLVERGVHLLEILDLEQLARDAVHEFLFICLPLRITGATGSWVRPIAVR